MRQRRSLYETHHSVVDHHGPNPVGGKWGGFGDHQIGGPGPNTLRGTSGADNLLGKGGNDVLFALGGNNDNLVGGKSKDWLCGGNERRALWRR